MPAPSKLSIATSSVLRLLKEESSYHKELEVQQGRISKLETSQSTDENAEFQLQQEKRALEETRAVFPPLRQRIMAAATHLEELLENTEDSDEGELTRARSALEQAKHLNA